jgi:hypothetical protein
MQGMHTKLPIPLLATGTHAMLAFATGPHVLYCTFSTTDSRVFGGNTWIHGDIICRSTIEATSTTSFTPPQH